MVDLDRQFDLDGDGVPNEIDTVDGPLRAQTQTELNQFKFHMDRSQEIASDVDFKFCQFDGNVQDWSNDQVIDFIENKFKIHTRSIKITDEAFRESVWLVRVTVSNTTSKLLPINSDWIVEDVNFFDVDSLESGKGIIVEMVPYRYDTLEGQLTDFQSQKLNNAVGKGITYTYYLGVNQRSNSDTKEV